MMRQKWISEKTEEEGKIDKAIVLKHTNRLNKYTHTREKKNMVCGIIFEAVQME